MLCIYEHRYVVAKYVLVDAYYQYGIMRESQATPTYPRPPLHLPAHDRGIKQCVYSQRVFYLCPVSPPV